MSLVDVNLSRCVGCQATDKTVLVIVVAKVFKASKPYAVCSTCWKAGER